MIATIPIVFPIVIGLGYDPLWFGVFLVVMCEIALITPPVGMNLYVVQGVRGHGSVGTVVRGTLPFVGCVFVLDPAADLRSWDRDVAAQPSLLEGAGPDGPITCIRSAAWIIAWDGERHVYRRGGDVAWRGDRLIRVGGRHVGPADHELDGSRALVMPGSSISTATRRSRRFSAGWSRSSATRGCSIRAGIASGRPSSRS